MRADGTIAKGKPLVVEPREAEVVRWLFERRAEVTCRGQLARWADSTASPHGVASSGRGARWRRSSATGRIWARPATGEHVKAKAHEAVVGLDLFEAANVARGIRPPRGKAALLSGLVRCAGCRHRMSAAVVGQRKQLVYRCKRQHGSGFVRRQHLSRARCSTRSWTPFLARYGAVELVGAVADDNLAEAAAAVAEAEAEFARTAMTFVREKRREALGGNAWTDGLERRAEAVVHAREVLQRARAQAVGLTSDRTAPTAGPRCLSASGGRF